MSNLRMMTLVATILGGALFGFALAAPPGPMNAVIATESVRRGWGAGFRAGLGAMAADACFFVLALVGVVAVVQRNPALRSVLFAVGGVLMLAFAVDAVKNARTAVSADRETGKGFQKTFALALTNPYQIAFWLTVGVGLLEPGRLDVLAPVPSLGGSLAGSAVIHTGEPTLVAGLFGGILVWIVAFPAALVTARRRVEAVVPLVAWLSGAVLAGTGLLFLAEAIRRF